MNHPSEWARYYDAPKGISRYKHKGTVHPNSHRKAVHKARHQRKSPPGLEESCRKSLEKVVEKAVEKAAEKGAEKIQAVLRGRKKTPLSTESRQKLKKMLTKSSKLSGDSRKKLNQILNPGRSSKLKVNQYLAEN